MDSDLTDADEANWGQKIAFLWFGTSLIAAAWTFLYVPETKSHSLEELDEMCLFSPLPRISDR